LFRAASPLHNCAQPAAGIPSRERRLRGARGLDKLGGERPTHSHGASLHVRQRRPGGEMRLSDSMRPTTWLSTIAFAPMLCAAQAPTVGGAFVALAIDLEANTIAKQLQQRGDDF